GERHRDAVLNCRTHSLTCEVRTTQIAGERSPQPVDELNEQRPIPAHLLPLLVELFRRSGQPEDSPSNAPAVAVHEGERSEAHEQEDGNGSNEGPEKME